MFVPIVRISSTFMRLALIISGVIIILFASVNHPNLLLSAEEVEVCKQGARCLIFLFSSMVIMLNELGIIPECTSYIVVGEGVDAGLLILAKLKRRE